MDFLEYQRRALAMAVYPGQDTDTGLAYATLGLAGEAGEVANKVKKVLRGDYSSASKREELGEELGDVLWYLSAAAREIGMSLDTIAERNIEKLESRCERGVLKGSGDHR